MGTNNYFYENRCVVVTDDDLEFGNHPPLGDYVRSLRDYERRLVEIQDDKLKHHIVVITKGYYCNACIDYVINPNLHYRDLSDIVENISIMLYYREKSLVKLKEIVDYVYDITDNINKSKDTLEVIYNTYNNRKGEHKTIRELFYSLINKSFEQDKILANDIIDKLKNSYGYEEYRSLGRFSNGESFYENLTI